MKVLVIGSGGREHSIVKALKSSTIVRRVFSWPGNAGVALDAELLPGEIKTHKDLGLWASENGISLVVIGPEAELAAGLSDELRRRGLVVFGPSQESAQLESSKIFAKQFMNDYGVPTARARVVTSVEETLKAVEALNFSPPFVLKADGLAAGKGVFVCSNREDLLDAARDIFENKKLGSAGERALLEEFQLGHEVSVLVLTNGQQYQVLPFGRDHKRLLDDDKGPNTGGMGVVAPIDLDPKLKAQICKEIIEPSLRGISERKFLFRGVLFIGLMLTPSGPQVLEYNVRFGDPETQAILPLLDGDWADVLRSIAQGDVPNLHWRKEATVCVVMAAQGYPDSAVKGVAIKALSNQSEVFDSGFFQILHAGTARAGDDFVTSGGRVLNVITRDSSREQALERAYRIVEKLAWPGAQWRRDIGRD